MNRIAVTVTLAACLLGSTAAADQCPASSDDVPTTRPDAADAPTTRPDDASTPPTTQPEAAAALDFEMFDIEGEKVRLSRYHGRVVLMVNVASRCGLTPQYKDLQSLHQTYAKEGLAILGFPANEFGRQEPGTNEQIQAFCESRYGVEFDMFAKVVVKGEGVCPLYAFLTGKRTNPKFAGPIRWNFTKFLLNRDGEVVARFEPRVKPLSKRVIAAIEAELGKPARADQADRPTSRPDEQ
jgi:glutathione peroxidase